MEDTIRRNVTTYRGDEEENIMDNNQNKVSAITQIFNGPNGKLLGALASVVVIFGIDQIVSNKYRVTTKKGNNSFSFTPAGSDDSIQDLEETEDNIPQAGEEEDSTVE